MFNIVFQQINKWYEAYFMSLNLDKTHFIHFMNKNADTTDTCIKYNISNITNTKFLGLFINDTFSWKTHIKYIMPKLSSACYAMRPVKLCVTEYPKNDLLFVLLLYYDLWIIVVGASFR
jgi:hypothetical protein